MNVIHSSGQIIVFGDCLAALPQSPLQSPDDMVQSQPAFREWNKGRPCWCCSTRAAMSLSEKLQMMRAATSFGGLSSSYCVCQQW